MLPQLLQTKPRVQQRLGHNQVLLTVERGNLVADVNLLTVLHLVERLVQVGADVAAGLQHALPYCLALLEQICANALLKCLVVFLGVDESP